MCEIDFDDEGRASMSSETPVRAARKEHCCDACGGTIAVGEPYTKHFSVIDGNPCSEKQCAPCTAASKAFTDEHDFWCVPSALRDFLVECAREGLRGGAGSADVWEKHVEAMDARGRAREVTE